MKVLITGSRGFIGKNLCLRLEDLGGFDIITYNRANNSDSLFSLVEQADCIVHLAGEMRPPSVDDLFEANHGLTRKICNILRMQTKCKMILLASSIQVEVDCPYGISKLQAEREIIDLSRETGISAAIYRLPHVFGKFCKPNYNSVIATFCHNIARELPIRINDPAVFIRPVYIDDVVSEFVRSIINRPGQLHMGKVEPEYKISVGDLAAKILSFRNSGDALPVDLAGDEFSKCLYLTYLSYLPN
jgi:UDP-2-acetamido-2,6-beta-L-arabino-hexul-4-ose reductase